MEFDTRLIDELPTLAKDSVDKIKSSKKSLEHKSTQNLSDSDSLVGRCKRKKISSNFRNAGLISIEEDKKCAEQAGFHPNLMEEFELKFYPEYEDYELDYLAIRNHILALWKQDPYQFLPLETVLNDFQEDYKDDVKRIYTFLTLFGRINVGSFANEEAKIENFSNNIVESKKVLVLGAGAAGLAAARQLKQFGYDVEIVEARDRLGGRVYTSNIFGAPIDHGASIITGLIGNPLDEPFRQLKLPARVIGDSSKIFWRSRGTVVDHSLDVSMDKKFNEMLEKASHMKNNNKDADMSLGKILDELSSDTTKEERCMLDWFYANLEYACATDLKNLSNNNWDQDDEHDFDGDHLMLLSGYSSMLEPLAVGIKVHLNQEIVSVDYTSPDFVKLTSVTGDTFIGDILVSTLPLGVLKADTCKFNPPLPKEKIKAKEIGFGLLNKIILKFSHNFWDQKVDFFGTINENDRSLRGQAYLLWNMHKFCSQPILMALCSGEAGHIVETLSDSELISDLVDSLKLMFNLAERPEPVKAVVTRWKSDRFARGSYSYLGIGTTGDDYDELARPIEDRIFFAGEATNRYHPATVAGAYQSGIREATNIHLKYYKISPITSISFQKTQKSIKPPKAKSTEKKISHCRRGVITQPFVYTELGAGNQSVRYKYSYLYAMPNENPSSYSDGKLDGVSRVPGETPVKEFNDREAYRREYVRKEFKNIGQKIPDPVGSSGMKGSRRDLKNLSTSYNENYRNKTFNHNFKKSDIKSDLEISKSSSSFSSENFGKETNSSSNDSKSSCRNIHNSSSTSGNKRFRNENENSIYTRKTNVNDDRDGFVEKHQTRKNETSFIESEESSAYGKYSFTPRYSNRSPPISRSPMKHESSKYEKPKRFERSPQKIESSSSRYDHIPLKYEHSVPRHDDFLMPGNTPKHKTEIVHSTEHDLRYKINREIPENNSLIYNNNLPKHRTNSPLGYTRYERMNDDLKYSSDSKGHGFQEPPPRHESFSRHDSSYFNSSEPTKFNQIFPKYNFNSINCHSNNNNNNNNNSNNYYGSEHNNSYASSSNNYPYYHHHHHHHHHSNYDNPKSSSRFNNVPPYESRSFPFHNERTSNYEYKKNNENNNNDDNYYYHSATHTDYQRETPSVNINRNLKSYENSKKKDNSIGNNPNEHHPSINNNNNNNKRDPSEDYPKSSPHLDASRSHSVQKSEKIYNNSISSLSYRDKEINTDDKLKIHEIEKIKMDLNTSNETGHELSVDVGIGDSQKYKKAIPTEISSTKRTIHSDSKQKKEFRLAIANLVVSRISSYFVAGAIESKDDFKEICRTYSHKIFEKEYEKGRYLLDEKLKKKVKKYLKSELERKYPTKKIPI